MPPQSLGLIGVGAFGEFIAPHLSPHFHLTLCDAHKDVAPLAKKHGVTAGDLKQAAACDVVVVAVQVQRMEKFFTEIAPLLKPGALVIEVGSVKSKPAEWMKKHLPANVDAIGLHPLFGPQSGKDGIAGLNVAVCNIHGERSASVCAFLKNELILNVFETTPQEHDRQLAYVQGLTHLIGKVIVGLDLPEFQLTTKTYDLMTQMVEMVRYDSDDLFRAIERENPFTAEAKNAFFTAARRLEEKLAKE
jgi:prephenate dehydrogenase